MRSAEPTQVTLLRRALPLVAALVAALVLPTVPASANHGTEAGLSVRPGWPLRVVVHKDIVFSRPWQTAEK